jgi:hypothetical protein
MGFERYQLFSYARIMMCAPLVRYYEKRAFENDQDSRSCFLCKLNGWVSLLISNEIPMYKEVAPPPKKGGKHSYVKNCILTLTYTRT